MPMQLLVIIFYFNNINSTYFNVAFLINFNYIIIEYCKCILWIYAVLLYNNIV